MTTSIVSTTVNHGVIPGESAYSIDLTITGSGVVNGITYGVYGTSLLGSVGINNAGHINGNDFGVMLTGLASLNNSGSIHGGVAGVEMQGGGLDNTGIITGGTIGLLVNNADLAVTNSGIIYGVTLGLYAQSSTITNSGSISGNFIAAQIENGSFTNSAGGTISSKNIGLAGDGAFIRNDGLVTGQPIGAGIYGTGIFDNTGVINGLGIGFYLETTLAPGATLNNSGTITAFNDGAEVIGGTVINSGTLLGLKDGVYVSSSAFAARITDTGFISGGTYAIDAVDSLALTLGTGARFAGALRDRAGDGLLSLTGSGSVSNFSGFSAIDFAAGAAWTLEDSAAGLAAGQEINGFTFGDTLKLDGFAATSDTLVADGLILSNGVTSETLNLAGSFVPQALSITSSGGSTTIALIEPPMLSIVSTLLTGGLNMNAAYVAQTVTVTNSGTVENYISGSYHSTIINSGLISGEISSVYRISNLDGTITSGSIAVAPGERGAVDNTGLISGQNTGVMAFKAQEAGGTPITNTGTIVGGVDGAIEYGGTVINSGLIAGGDYALYSSSVYESGTNPDFYLDLIVMSGARFDGKVEDMTGAGLLNLSGSTAGSIDIGSSFSGFSLISFAPNVSWSLEGAVGDLAAGETIAGFTLGDTIILDSFSAASYSYVSGTGLVLSNGTTSETLDIRGSFTTRDFAVTNGADALAITNDVVAPCFCAGTRIATSRGNVAVEALQIGDLVRTAAQGLQPVRWIGRRGYEGRFIAGNHLALPVKIRRHALGFNVPSRDLFVSPDHALAEGGVLVHAWRFINGASITQAQSVERVEYFHIELENHAVIFAENTPVESFLDTGCRGRFQNVLSAPEDLAPQEACLPRVEDGYYLARLKARIDARAGIFVPAVMGRLRGCVDESGPLLRGWAQDAAAPDAAVELELVCDGRVVQRFLANRYRADLRAAGLGAGCHAFELALPVLNGPLTLRRVGDGAVLGDLIVSLAS